MATCLIRAENVRMRQVTITGHSGADPDGSGNALRIMDSGVKSLRRTRASRASSRKPLVTCLHGPRYHEGDSLRWTTCQPDCVRHSTSVWSRATAYGHLLA